MTVMPDDVPADDDAFDLCDLDFTEFAVSDETADLLALFPDSVADEATAQRWRDFGVAYANGEFGV